ncbi:hypothetical protein [Lysinibacillus sp. LZ02]|uniref:hypothetical protein n=1 Tax=Lysinibacillus sp. LZ02 TaxID=3420668 RepID=UPI003D36BC80
MNEGILEELDSLAEFVECFKLFNCNELSLEQLPKVIFKVENRTNRLKRLLKLKEA